MATIAYLNLGDNLGHNLRGNGVVAEGLAVLAPLVGRAHKVLVLHVQEVLRIPTTCEMRSLATTKHISGTGGAVCNFAATDTLGHRDVSGLSATDPHRKQWKDVGMHL